jgi:hypothetical protein
VAGGDLTQADLNALSPQERMAALRKLAAGGDLAAGGGGFGLVPARLGTTLAGAGVGTGVGGLAGGGLGLAAGHEGDQLKEDVAAGAGLGALAGGSVGSVAPEIAPAAAHLATEVGAKFGDTGVDPGLWADAVKVGWQHFQDVRATAGVRGPKEAFDAFWRQWRSQVVNTVKQVPQDALTRKFVQEGIARKEFGLTDGDIRAFQGVLRRERAGGVSGLDNPLTARLRALGASGVLADMQRPTAWTSAPSWGRRPASSSAGWGAPWPARASASAPASRRSTRSPRSTARRAATRPRSWTA